MLSMFLIDRVGCARYHMVSDTRWLAAGCRRSVALRAQEIPAALQVPDHAVRFVLCGDRDAADAGIECVGQRKTMMRDLPPKKTAAWRACR